MQCSTYTWSFFGKPEIGVSYLPLERRKKILVTGCSWAQEHRKGLRHPCSQRNAQLHQTEPWNTLSNCKVKSAFSMGLDQETSKHPFSISNLITLISKQKKINILSVRGFWYVLVITIIADLKYSIWKIYCHANSSLCIALFMFFIARFKIRHNHMHLLWFTLYKDTSAKEESYAKRLRASTSAGKSWTAVTIFPAWSLVPMACILQCPMTSTYLQYL